MANDTNYVVAIDIGTSNVVTLIGERSESGKVRIIASSITPSSGMVRGDVKNVEQIVASIEESLNSISTSYNIKICEAYVGLSGQHIKCSQHSGYVFIKNSDSEVSRKDVDDLTESMGNVQVDAGETIIHILPQNYILDGDDDISHPVGMIGTKLEGKFNIVIGGKKLLMLLERCFNRTQVGLAGVVLSSLASAEAVLLDDEKELGVIVVDIGGGTTDVCIYYDKTVRYMGVIPVGGNFINKDIKSIGVLERYVERLKVKFGSALSDVVPENKIITLASINNIPSKEIAQKELASIIEARMMDVIESLQKILSRSDFNKKLKGPIVLTGGCANIKDIDKLFAQQLGCDVRIASPTMFVTDDSVDKVNSPQYSTAVGLLLKGMVIGRPTKTIMLKKPRPLVREDEDNFVSENKKPLYGAQKSGTVKEYYKTQDQNNSTPSFDDEEQESPTLETTIDVDNKKSGLFSKLRNFFSSEDLEDDDL